MKEDKTWVEIGFGWLDKLAATLNRSILSLFQDWAAIAAPVFPSIMFASNIYVSETTSGRNHTVALVAAVFAAFALEATGMSVLNSFVKLWTKNDVRKWFLAGATLAYFGFGIATAFLETTSTDMRMLTFLAFGITSVAYFAKAFQDQISKEESLESYEIRQEKIRDQKEWERKENERKEAAEHRRKMKELELTLPQPVATFPQQVSGNLPKVSESFPSDKRKLTSEQKRKMAKMFKEKSIANIASETGLEQRSLRNWRDKYAVDENWAGE